MLGDTQKLSIEQARTLQERRCTRLAGILAAKIQPWVAEDYEACKVMWQTEAKNPVGPKIQPHTNTETNTTKTDI